MNKSTKRGSANSYLTHTKSEKGITLIALIITIVVLLILAVVSIGTVQNSKIITHAQSAKNTYNEEQIKEEVTLYSVEYLMNTKKNMQDTPKETMIQIYKETGVKPEQLTVYYDLYNANQNKTNENSELQEEYVLYRIDKTTNEERTKLEEKGIKALYGDFDLDGYLTTNDVFQIKLYDNWGIDHDEVSEEQVEIGDIYQSGEVDTADSGIVEWILQGRSHYEGGHLLE